jgi:hypothetical protein
MSEETIMRAKNASPSENQGASAQNSTSDQAINRVDDVSGNAKSEWKLGAAHLPATNAEQKDDARPHDSKSHDEREEPSEASSKIEAEARELLGHRHPNQLSRGLTARQVAYSLFPPLFESCGDQPPSQEYRDAMLRAFLLWPPDLFAFTSYILSATGAYHLVVSPPSSKFYEIAHRDPIVRERLAATGIVLNDCNKSFFQWPPKIDITDDSQLLYVEGDQQLHYRLLASCSGEDATTNYKWAKEMGDVGLRWRWKLQKHFNRNDMEAFKHGTEAERQRLLDEKIGNAKTEGQWLPRKVFELWEVIHREFTPDGAVLGSLHDILCNEDDESYRKALQRIDEREREAKALFDLKNKENPHDRETHWQKHRDAKKYIAALTTECTFLYASKIIHHWIAFQALLSLHAIADEACVGLGIRSLWFYDPDDPAAPKDQQYKDIDSHGKSPASSADDECYNLEFFDFAKRRLDRFGTISNVHEHRGRVLPKRHTPSVGITLRSISNHLCYHRSSVDVKWQVASKEGDNDLLRKLRDHQPINNPQTFSVLLLPWPLEIRSPDFRTEVTERIDVENRHQLFSYSPERGGFDQTMLLEALHGALDETNSIDMVILPEGAMTIKEIPELENIISDHKYKVSVYVAGVRHDGKRDADDKLIDLHDNMVFFKMGTFAKGEQQLIYPLVDPTDTDAIQFKHHKWKLERSQIISYNLGHVLSPTVDWWEAIKIRRRKVTFMNLGQEMTICPLICEDLARQDPIADLIRTVGPSLVITILMDGPQRKDRWSSRYATVLAEDPGCAVITLTSYGMVRRWKPEFLSQPCPRIVALWNDGQGSAREIELEEGSIGVLLSLSLKGKLESTADGREEKYPTNTLTLGGIHQVKRST